MDTQQNQTTIERRIHLFKQKAGKNAAVYQDFLVLIAQPLLFSTDFLYKLWLNFKGYHQKDPKEQPSYLVVSDFILSSLCQPIGTDLFRMEEDIREYILLQTTKEIRQDVALFIEEYALRNKSNLSKNIFEIHSLFAEGILRPKEMEKKIIEKLKSEAKPNEKANYLSLYFNSPSFDGNGSQKAGISLVRVDNPNEENVLKLGYLPKGIEENLEKYEGINVEKIEKTLLDERIEENLATKDTSLDLSAFDIDEISRISKIFNCSYLEELYLQHNYISDISFLSNLKNLEILDLFGNSVSDIFSLSELKKIAILVISNNQVSDISPLSDLNQLKELDLDGNRISDISFLSNLKQLQGLQLFDNQISDISSLAKLQSLKVLDISNNQISDISSLSELKNIKKLHLDNNDISNISPLLELPNLKELYLKGNPIENIPKEIYDFDGNCLEVVREYFENTLMGQMDEEFEKFRIDMENDWKKIVENKVQELKEYAKQGSMEKVFDYLDLYFNKNPQVQYATLKKEFMTASSSYFTTLERLIVFLNSEIVKEAISFIEQEQAIEELNKPVDIKSYGTQKEIQGLEKAIEMLEEKRTFLRQELVIAQNAAIKFDFAQKLKDLEKEIEAYRKKLESLVYTPSVFISYNNKDKGLVTKIKEELRENDVLIDSETMKVGEDIKIFIERSVKESDYVLVLVSQNSLLSSWITIESFLVFNEKTFGKKLIPLYEDDSFFSDDFLKEGILQVKRKKEKIEEEIRECQNQNVGTEHLQEEYERYVKLENNLPNIIESLRNFISIDISKENFEMGMRQLVGAIISSDHQAKAI